MESMDCLSFSTTATKLIKLCLIEYSQKVKTNSEYCFLSFLGRLIFLFCFFVFLFLVRGFSLFLSEWTVVRGGVIFSAVL